MHTETRNYHWVIWCVALNSGDITKQKGAREQESCCAGMHCNTSPVILDFVPFAQLSEFISLKTSDFSIN